MAESEQQPPQTKWRFTHTDRQFLSLRFRQDLRQFLQAVNEWRESDQKPSDDDLRELAEELETAARELDIAAANSQAVAATLRAYADGNSTSAASAEAGIRLKNAVGQNVLLTHTTIEQLAGKILTLEYIDGKNAIVQIEGEFWGTPLDRVLVLPEKDETADTIPEEMQPAPAFRFRLRGGEISNVIQFLTMTSRTGILQVAFVPQQAHGNVTFRDGRVLNATLEEHVGIEAVARMMNLNSAEATFVDDAGVDGKSIESRLSTEQLLIEAAVKADEMRDRRSRRNSAD